MTELVTIASDALTARINPLGAELWSLADGQGREYMTDADPAFWTGHAPVLFPIVGMLNAGRYRLGDESYELSKHGFARHSLFDVVEASGSSARFRLADSDATRAVYPFAFVLDVVFFLAGAALQVRAEVTNPSTDALPFSLGFHPAFAWPLPDGGAKEDHRLVFEQPEPEPIRRIDPPSGLLLPETFATPVTGRELVPDASMFEADALIWDQPTSRSASFVSATGARLDVSFPDATMLGVWQKPGAAYLCIEPWLGIADPVGFAGDFRDKPGVVQLPAGETLSFRMDVTVAPAN